MRKQKCHFALQIVSIWMASILVRCVFCDGDAKCIIWWTAEMSSLVFTKIAYAGFCWCDAGNLAADECFDVMCHLCLL